MSASGHRSTRPDAELDKERRNSLLFPEEDDARTISTKVTFETGGNPRRHEEDALHNRRLASVDTSGVFAEVTVSIVPGDHFLIRGVEKEYIGLHRFDSQYLLFRNVSTGKVKSILKSDFTNAFGSSDDIFYRCRRIKSEGDMTAREHLRAAMRKSVPSFLE